MVHSHSGSTPPPSVFSTPRIATLLSSLLVSLASGTNYSTPKAQALLVLGFVSLLVGYNGIRYFYDAGLPGEARRAWGSGVFFLTGIGGNGGLASAMNATAKSFPDGARATVTGLVISGFGLSAFLFSTIAHLVFPGNTSDFLLLLAIGTSLPMVLGFFYVRPIPLPHHHTHHHAGTNIVETPPVSAIGRDHGHSRTNLLDSPPDAGSYNLPLSLFPLPHFFPTLPPSSSSSSSDEDDDASPESYRRHRSRARSLLLLDIEMNVRGKALVGEGMFWVLFVTTSLLSGTGLMYINNVGSISQALFAKGIPNSTKERRRSGRRRSLTVSVANCLGRVLIGVIADFTKNNLHRPRSWCMALVSGLFIVSQVTVALLGLAYGGLFGLFPTLHFSENWDSCRSRLSSGERLLHSLGRNLDAHAPSEPKTLSILQTHRISVCWEGVYAGSLLMTIAACSTALCLSVYAGWRDWRRVKREERGYRRSVVWDAEED
ncbi:hypothetical protein BC629DRAFT_1662047 [Irpex lacteus]|nr:hypothetical protein BC629DRAFT_1662047 [Irpex lacteus]